MRNAFRRDNHQLRAAMTSMAYSGAMVQPPPWSDREFLDDFGIVFV